MVKITKSASIDRSSVFERLSLVVSIFCNTLFSLVLVFFSSQKRHTAQDTRTLRRAFPFRFRARSRLGDLFFSAHYNISPLSLSLSNNTVCCIGAGYVGGPTMAMIALKCPHIEVNREHVSRQVFARFIMTSSSICIRLQNAGVQNVSVFDTPPGPGGAIFSTRARRNRRREQSETNDWSRW